VDQNGHDERPACVGQCTTYQGVLYIWPSDDTSTTTVVWPGSHLSVWPRLMQQPVYREQGSHGVHYSPLACLDGTALGAELADGWQRHGRRLRVPAGALLLWNSRVVHCGWQGRGPRLAQAVCLERATARPVDQRTAKLRLAALGLPSTHWARLGHQHDMVPPDDAGFLASVWVGRESNESSPVRSSHPVGGEALRPPESSRPRGADRPSEVVLPLRHALRPVALRHDADYDALRRLVSVPCMRAPSRAGVLFGGIWQPTEGGEEEAVLEAAVKDEYKRLL